MPSPHLVLDWLPPESPFGKKVTAPWLLCLAWWMRGTCRKQPPKAWHWLLLAFWSHHGWLSSPWPSDLWCPWAGAACATLLLRQPRDRSQALILLEAGATLPVGQELLKSDRKDCTLMPPSTTAPHPNFYQDSTAASIVILWTTWARARQTSLPDPASQITDSNKKTFIISIFTSDICLTSAASQEELSRQLPIIHLTISKQNAAGSEGGQDGILAKSVSSGLQQTCI